MRTATSGGLARIRASYDGSTRDLFQVLLNATSQTEANFALDILAETVDEKTLVAAVNLREVLASLPLSPFSMRVDEQTLLSTAGLTRHRALMGKVLDDGAEILVTTAGNLVLDVIISAPRGRFYLSPMPATEDFVTPGLIDVLVESDVLVDSLVDLVTAMGLVFNPKFYLSVEDWHLEYAKEAVCGLEDLFGSERSATRTLNIPEI